MRLRLEKSNAELCRSRSARQGAGTQPSAIRSTIGLFGAKKDIDVLVAGLKAIPAGDCSHDHVCEDQACSDRPSSWDYVLSRTFAAEWIPNRAGCSLE